MIARLSMRGEILGSPWTMSARLACTAAATPDEAHARQQSARAPCPVPEHRADRIPARGLGRRSGGSKTLSASGPAENEGRDVPELGDHAD